MRSAPASAITIALNCCETCIMGLLNCLVYARKETSIPAQTAIPRFYDIQSGEITYDGLDVKSINKDDLRRSLGVVLQDTHLFTGTVIDNIRYGRLDATDVKADIF